jgi:hypothetical protein
VASRVDGRMGVNANAEDSKREANLGGRLGRGTEEACEGFEL